MHPGGDEPCMLCWRWGSFPQNAVEAQEEFKAGVDNIRLGCSITQAALRGKILPGREERRWDHRGVESGLDLLALKAIPSLSSYLCSLASEGSGIFCFFLPSLPPFPFPLSLSPSLSSIYICHGLQWGHLIPLPLKPKQGRSLLLLWISASPVWALSSTNTGIAKFLPWVPSV